MHCGTLSELQTHSLLIGSLAAASGTNSAPTSDLLQHIILSYVADPLFSSVDELKKIYAKSKLTLPYSAVWLTDSGAILVPHCEKLHHDIVSAAHDANCGHGGVAATFSRFSLLF